MADKELLKWLSHNNAWHRHTAQRLLQKNPSRKTVRLLKRRLKKAGELETIHILWTLHGLQALDLKEIDRALDSENPWVRTHALKAGQTKLKLNALLTFLKKEHSSLVQQHALMYLQPHNHKPQVLTTLVQQVPNILSDAKRQVAIRSAALGQEIALVELIAGSKFWSAAYEQKHKLVSKLITQAARLESPPATEILDLANASKELWLQDAILDGILEVTRDNGFTRFNLQQPHPIFTAAGEQHTQSITNARKAYTWPNDTLAANAKPLTPQQQHNKQLGADYYAKNCANCHGKDGKGIINTAPSLVDSPWVIGATETLAAIVLDGLQGPIEVNDEQWNSVMPGHKYIESFNDDVASGLITFLRRSWGHAEPVASPQLVASMRNPSQPMWSVETLKTLELNTRYKNYTGTYGPFVIEYNNNQLIIKSAILNGPLVETKEDHFLFTPRNVALEFIWDNKTVTAVRMASETGGNLIPRMPIQ